MENIRCGKCRRLLAKATYREVQIKCHRCGAINHRTTEPAPEQTPGRQDDPPTD